MKPEVIRELTNILYELDWKADREELKNRFEESITNLFNHIKIRESVKQAISEIPDSWPQPAIKLFAILIDYMASDLMDVDLDVSTRPEGVAIRFNEDHVLRLEKTMNNS